MNTDSWNLYRAGTGLCDDLKVDGKDEVMCCHHLATGALFALHLLTSNYFVFPPIIFIFMFLPLV